MTLFSYIVARDYGFAPNPFYNYCTLAACKGRIRQYADVDDWVVGTGSKGLGYTGKLIYAMRVTEKLTFNEYWEDGRFQIKKPVLNGSSKRCCGDNIYYKDEDDIWHQSDSHHSLEGGVTNQLNLQRDTKNDYVLISDDFLYCGNKAIIIPGRLALPEPKGMGLCFGRQGHKSSFSKKQISGFLNWLNSKYPPRGRIGDPIQSDSFERYDGRV